MPVITHVCYTGIKYLTCEADPRTQLFDGDRDVGSDVKLRIKKYEELLFQALKNALKGGGSRTFWRPGVLHVIMFPEFFFRGGPHGWYDVTPGSVGANLIGPVVHPTTEKSLKPKDYRLAGANWLLRKICDATKATIHSSGIHEHARDVHHSSQSGIIICAGTGPFGTQRDAFEPSAEKPIDTRYPQYPEGLIKIDNFAFFIEIHGDDGHLTFNTHLTTKMATARQDYWKHSPRHPYALNSFGQALRAISRLDGRIYRNKLPRSEDYTPTKQELTTNNPLNPFISFEKILISDPVSREIRPLIFCVEICLDYFRRYTAKIQGIRHELGFQVAAADMDTHACSGDAYRSNYAK